MLAYYRFLFIFKKSRFEIQLCWLNQSSFGGGTTSISFCTHRVTRSVNLRMKAAKNSLNQRLFATLNLLMKTTWLVVPRNEHDVDGDG